MTAELTRDVCPRCGSPTPITAVICPFCATELAAADQDPLLGQMVGTYRVVRRLGLGGMGAVYEAVEANIDKRAALKIVHPHLSNDPRLPSLMAEAKAVNAIGDEGIVDVYGFGTLPDGRSYLLMELLEGEPLETRLARQGMFTVLETIELLAPVLQALEAAHQAGFVHRDIKSANIFIVQRPSRAPFPKLLDFGISQRITIRSEFAVGTPDYISPEQAANRAVGPKADLYSFGCLMFELLTGRLPFIDPDPMQVVRMHQEDPRPSARAERGDLPEELDALISALMQIEPDARPASAAAVREVLLQVRARLEPTRRRRWPALVAVLTVALIATLAVRLNHPTAAGEQPDPIALEAARAAVKIEAALDGGTDGVDRLLAAEAAFPGRGEWVALRGRLSTALRLEVQQALARDDADDATGRLATLRRLNPAGNDDPLEAELQRLRFAQRNGMARVGEVFIDRYEYPNRAGAVPVTRVDWAEAVKLCEAAGKHLCTEQEWQAACSGRERHGFPYGEKLETGRCLGHSKKLRGPAPAGSFTRCAGAAGVFDLSGNVAEWTATALREGAPQRVTRGGSFGQSDAKLSCEARDYSLPGLGGAAHLGLRCCL